MIRALVQLRAAGVDIGIGDLIGMSLRGTLKRELVDALILVAVAKLDIADSWLEAHLLAGGRPDRVVTAAVALRATAPEISPEYLMALDLGAVDVAGVAHAFSKASRSDNQLRFDEVLERYRSGEDVINDADRGSLRSNRRHDGWRVRFEYGPVNLEQIEALIERAAAGAKIEVSKPGQSSWQSLERLRANGVLGLPAALVPAPRASGESNDQST